VFNAHNFGYKVVVWSWGAHCTHAEDVEVLQPLQSASTSTLIMPLNTRQSRCTCLERSAFIS